MFSKLVFRNVRRSARDYLVYVLTMTFIVALIFAFNSIIFSRDLQKMYEMATMMAAMIGIATFFIVLIVAWLINYMVRFMLEKRSREFGIYLLIGMKKKEVCNNGCGGGCGCGNDSCLWIILLLCCCGGFGNNGCGCGGGCGCGC